MSILIKGMDMPVEGLVTVNIHSDGTVYVYGAYPTELHEAVPVLTPHGPLIDARALYENTVEWEAEAFDQLEKFDPQDERQRGGWKCWNIVLAERTAFKHDVMDAPIIIEAEEGEGK